MYRILSRWLCLAVLVGSSYKAQYHCLSSKVRPAWSAALITYVSEVLWWTCTGGQLHTGWRLRCISRLLLVRVEVKLIMVAVLVPPGNYSFYCSTHPWHDWWTAAKECEAFHWTCSCFLLLSTDDPCLRFQGCVDRPGGEIWRFCPEAFKKLLKEQLAVRWRKEGGCFYVTVTNCDNCNLLVWFTYLVSVKLKRSRCIPKIQGPRFPSWSGRDLMHLRKHFASQYLLARSWQGSSKMGRQEIVCVHGQHWGPGVP